MSRVLPNRRKFIKSVFAAAATATGARDVTAQVGNSAPQTSNASSETKSEGSRFKAASLSKRSPTPDQLLAQIDQFSKQNQLRDLIDYMGNNGYPTVVQHFQNTITTANLNKGITNHFKRLVTLSRDGVLTPDQVKKLLDHPNKLAVLCILGILNCAKDNNIPTQELVEPLMKHLRNSPDSENIYTLKLNENYVIDSNGKQITPQQEILNLYNDHLSRCLIDFKANKSLENLIAKLAMH